MTDRVPTAPTARAARPRDVVLPGTAERIVSGIPENTRRSYTEAWRQFTDWCTTTGREGLPTTAATLAEFTAHLCNLGKAPATIAHRLAVISAHHPAHGYPALGKDVTTAANLILRGYRRDRANTTQRRKEAPPITRERLRMISGACNPDTLTGKRDRLLLVLGWALAARRSELAALRIDDVRIARDELEILIRSSKTDKDSQGETIDVPAGQHLDTDPVGLLNDWLTALAGAGVDTTTGPLFRAITQHDRLYRYDRLSPAAINGIVRRAAIRAGLPNAHLYTAHSLRAGFATQASAEGIPMSLWAEHGRWVKTSPVPAKYVRQADRKRDNPLRRMGL